MKISTRGRYGLYAMLDLALHQNKGPVTAKDISSRQDISVTYLEQLLSKLKKAGLVKGVRGPGGGYQLSRLDSEIRIGDIIRILEGPIAPVFCLPQSKSRISCAKKGHCACFPLWEKMAIEIEEVLDSSTLKDLRLDAERLGNSL